MAVELVQVLWRRGFLRYRSASGRRGRDGRGRGGGGGSAAGVLEDLVLQVRVSWGGGGDQRLGCTDTQETLSGTKAGDHSKSRSVAPHDNILLNSVPSTRF